MHVFTARELALVCVLGVTMMCSGCYQPAVGNNKSGGSASSSAVVAKPISTPSPTSQPSPQPMASAPLPLAASSTAPKSTPSATGTGTQLASAVDAALRNPMPNATPGASATATGSRTPVSRSPSRSPNRTKVLSAPQAAGGVIGMTFDDLVFPIEKDQPFVETMLTQAVRGYLDQKVKIRGYIHPSCPFQTGVTSFILVRDDQSCCFGPGAALYDCIIVDMVPGRTTNFTPKPIAVEGVLKFREFKDLDGKHLAVYHLDGEAVE
jgi:hypothetical protein